MSTFQQPVSVFRVRAHNTASDSENKIHDDKIAAAYGFRGGLVPGVTMYGYLVPAVLERLGPGWLERGGIAVRFHAPCYEGDMVLARCDGSTVTAEQEDGSLYASGVVSLAAEKADAGDPVTFLSSYPLPEMEQRPVATSSTIQPGTRLGTIRAVLDVGDIIAIPERLLRMANEILVRNFCMSPWIHAASEVHHHQLAKGGEEITVNGMIEECFERKGRKFAVAKLQMMRNGGLASNLLATVHHTFIYEL